MTSTYALVVDDLDNGRQSAGVGALGEHCDAADLDEAPVAGCDGCFAHFGGDVTGLQSAIRSSSTACEFDAAVIVPREGVVCCRGCRCSHKPAI